MRRGARVSAFFFDINLEARDGASKSVMAAIGMTRVAFFGSAALCGSAALTPAAYAGGLSVREQSTTFLGSAFAGAAAGSDLSSMYWNPAAAAVPGCSSASSYNLVIGRNDDTARSGQLVSGTLGFRYRF